jgi:sterol desaturase/sphingolipid hydroxylase (fatty acid hydroxylase superfamily)
VTVTDIYLKVTEGFELAGGYFIDPNKRVYFGFLISTLLLAFLVYASTRPKVSFFKYLFNKKVWWGNSPKVDYLFLFLNGVFKVVFIGPFLILGLYLSFYIKEYLLNHFDYPTVVISKFWMVLGYTLVLFVVKDLSSFLVHYLFHKVPFLWRFHKVHHAATVLNPITQYRIHPIELLVNNLKGIFVFGVVTGLFDYLANGAFNVLAILGVNVFGFVFMALGANLRHSHVKLFYPEWMESIFISPVQHQIHHSQNPKHFDRNLGSVLSVWDNLVGTLIKSKDTGAIRFGLGGKENKNFVSFWQNLFPKN